MDIAHDLLERPRSGNADAVRTDTLLTVVFPTYNRAAEVAVTLQHLRDNLSLKYEVVILDNSPESSSYDLRPNEVCHFLGRNLGTFSRNLGIQQATGKYILMLDDDSHPRPGSVEVAIERLNDSCDEVAGIMGCISNLDGRLMSSLLPTTYHGCGALFRASALKRLDECYPADFCFYGEEYWVTLQLYRLGYRLVEDCDFKICHRMSNQGRSLDRIFYYLARNNRIIWERFAPRALMPQVLYDTQRRYELLSLLECVNERFEEGLRDELTWSRTPSPLSVRQFREFALLDRIELFCRVNPKVENVVLCGTGKFPSLWADTLHRCGVKKVQIADLNDRLCGRNFGPYEVVYKERAQELGAAGHTCIIGHSASVDMPVWRRLLKDTIPPTSLYRL